MAVAFPLGVGIALVLGVVVNYISTPKGDPLMLFAGVALIMMAIIFNGVASSKMSVGEKKSSSKGIWLALIAGVLMSFFYRFVAAAMDINNFESPTPGMATPYSAFFIFTIGMLVSNFLFNTLLMKKPFVGESVSFKDYFKGSFPNPPGRCSRRIDLGVGYSLKFSFCRKSGCCHFLWPGARSHHGGRVLGCIYLERI
jgi:glucose uptake protein